MDHEIDHDRPRPVIERYVGLLAAALESEGRIILPDEAERLASDAVLRACHEGAPRPPGRCEAAFGAARVRW